MVKIDISDNRKRQIAAFVLVIASIVIFLCFPDSFSGLTAGVPGYAAYITPIFLLCVVASLILDVSIENKWMLIAAKVFACAMALLALFYASELLAGRHFWYLFMYNSFVGLYGYGIVFFLGAILFACTGSLPWTLRITTIITLLFGYVNYFVVQFRGTPLVPTDIYGAQTALGVLSGYTFTLSRALVESLFIGVCIFVLAPRLKLPKVKRAPRWGARAVALVLSVLFFTSTMNKQFIYAHSLQPDYWDQLQTVEQNGSIVNFLANIPDSMIERPQGYSLEAVNAIASQYRSDSISDAEETPDVILILGESWADLVPEGYARTNVDPLSFMSGLNETENGLYSNLIVSTIGGGTSRSEFQVLTGASVEYGIHSAPFQVNVTEPIPSIVDSFHQLGYDTTAIHPGQGSAWGRDTAFPLLGFDRFITIDDFEDTDGKWLRYYLRDSVMYDQALEILDDAVKPQFLYLISIATHGGYTQEDFKSTVSIQNPTGQYSMTEQYLSLLRESDQDLRAFIASLQERNRPTIVLFFGDHIPNVDNAYLDLAVEPSDEEMWRYKTFYGVWSNYTLPASSIENTSYLSISYLGPYLMERAGLPLTGYQKFLLAGAQDYPVVSASGLMDSSGVITPWSEAPSLALYQEQSILQYNFVMDRENISEAFFYLQP